MLYLNDVVVCWDCVRVDGNTGERDTSLELEWKGSNSNEI